MDKKNRLYLSRAAALLLPANMAEQGEANMELYGFGWLYLRMENWITFSFGDCFYVCKKVREVYVCCSRLQWGMQYWEAGRRVRITLTTKTEVANGCKICLAAFAWLLECLLETFVDSLW